MSRHTLLALVPFVVACAETPFVAEPEWSGEATETALIWNGFDQTWQYNHRLNRLGNWVGPVSCDATGCRAEIAQSAASGLGSDEATWSACGTAITAPGVGFLAGSTAFEIDEPAGEGTLVEQSVIVTVPAEGLLAGRSQYHVLLNGYDVFALGDADMFRSLHLAVGEVEVDEAAGTLSFPVTFALRTGCSAFECDGTWDIGGKADRSFHYGALVMWQVIGADAQIAATPIDIADAYGWEGEGAEVHREDHAIFGTAGADRRIAGGAYDAATIGTRSIDLVLDHDSHLLEVATGIADFAYDPATGAVDYAADLFFKQWNAETVEKPTSVVTPGEVQASASFTLLRFAGAQVESVEVGGSIDWTADGRPATGEAAVDRVDVAL